MQVNQYLFNRGEFIGMTIGLADADVGVLIRLFCMQHLRRRLSIENLEDCGSVVRAFFVSDEDGFYNEWVERAIQRRSAYSNSRSANRSGAFVRPTVDDVRAYCIERRNGIDAQAFIDFYESKGWVVGRSSMKDWKAAVRTWEKNNFKKVGNN